MLSVAARLALATEASEIRAILESVAEEIRGDRGARVHLSEIGSVGAVDDEMIASGRFDVVVGTIDESVVGTAVCSYEQLSIGAVGCVRAFGVLPGARGVGVGAAMFDLVVEHSRERSCIGIDVSALPGARETKNFFESHGFTARRLVLHKHLGGDRRSPPSSTGSAIGTAIE